jgi:hypothetical protein
MEIEQVNYRVVEMESGDFLLQEAVKGMPWMQAQGTCEYATAACAITALKTVVEARERIADSFTVKSVIMTEYMLEVKKGEKEDF